MVLTGMCRWQRRTRNTLTLLFGLAASWPAQSATITWTGAAGNDWATTANWSPARAPQFSDVADIPAGTPFVPVVSTPDTLCGGIVLHANATIRIAVGATVCVLGPGDLDRDGIPDLEEVIPGAMDVDGDGLPNFDDLDSDGDGMSDSWEHQQDDPFNPYSSEGAGGPDADYDGDGFSNLQECRAGTDPTDRDSYPLPMPLTGRWVLALTTAAVVLLTTVGLRRGGRWSRAICIMLVIGAVALSGGLLLAEGGGGDASYNVDFAAGQTIQAAVSTAVPGSTIQVDGGSIRPWNGETTYLTKPVTLAASNGTVFLGGMRTTLNVEVVNEGKVEATSAYTASDHSRPVRQSVAYATQAIACFLGEHLTLVPIPKPPATLAGWSGDASGTGNPLGFQVTRAGLRVVAQFSPPGPNLAVTWVLGAPVTAKLGDTLTVSVAVSNTGMQTTTGSSWTDGVYLSRDTVFDAGDLLLATHAHTGALSAGSSYAVAFPPVVLPDIAPGRYHLLAVIDTMTQVTETLRDDNVATDEMIMLDAVLAQ